MYAITLSFSDERSRCTASIDISLVAIPTASTIRGHNEKTIGLRDDYLAFIWATVGHRLTWTGGNSALTAMLLANENKLIVFVWNAVTVSITNNSRPLTTYSALELNKDDFSIIVFLIVVGRFDINLHQSWRKLDSQYCRTITSVQ